MKFKKLGWRSEGERLFKPTRLDEVVGRIIKAEKKMAPNSTNKSLSGSNTSH